MRYTKLEFSFLPRDGVTLLLSDTKPGLLIPLMTAISPPMSHSRSKEFREQLLQRAMVADGAMGTVLYSKGVFINRCFDELNLSMPALVKETHQEYVKAGAEIIETNTFGATRTRLAAFGLAEKIEGHQPRGRPAGARGGGRRGVRRRRHWTVGRAHRAAWVRCRSPRRAKFFASRPRLCSTPASIC